jgi:hypothetical protein
MNFMEEIIFLVTKSPEGGFTAKGLDVAIFTESGTIEELSVMANDAVQCHFDDGKQRTICLHS